MYFRHRTDRQWIDLSFCLAQLSYNERSLRKLQENFACFQGTLSNDDVYGFFNTIIGKCKKMAKPEIKVLSLSCLYTVFTMTFVYEAKQETLGLRNSIFFQLTSGGKILEQIGHCFLSPISLVPRRFFFKIEYYS